MAFLGLIYKFSATYEKMDLIQLYYTIGAKGAIGAEASLAKFILDFITQSAHKPSKYH